MMVSSTSRKSEPILLIISDFPSLNYQYAMWRDDSPEPEQANKSAETSPDRSSKWGQITVGSFLSCHKWNPLNSIACMDKKATCDEVERLRQVGEGFPYTCFYLTDETANQSRRKTSRVLSGRSASCRGAGSSTR